jgi:N-methylhydantoinase B
MNPNEATVAKTTHDQFTAEVIKEGLIAIGDEMFIALQRTSMSPIIYEVLDYATGLTDATGELMTQGNGVTGFIGTLSPAVKSVLAKYGDEIRPGDMFMTNVPYEGGGTHLSDVSLLMPIFYDGRVVAFSASKAHWTEVGGMAPGSWTTDSTEIFQEGLQFPCVRLYDEGRINQALVEVIEVNVRLPEMTLGDLHAQAAAMRVGERRMQELCDKYGVGAVLHSIEGLLDHGERMSRAELAKLPRGVYEAEDFIDDDGMGTGPIRVCVKVTITEDRFICDFTGSDAQVTGPINATRTGLESAVRTIYKAVTNPQVPVNDGAFRPLEVICPSGTVLTAERPAPVSTYFESMILATDLVWKALAAVLPGRLSAGHLSSVCSTIVSGTHPDTGELFLLVEPEVGGWGAGAEQDGEAGQFCVLDGETYVIPIEIAETRYGVRVEQFALDITDAGAGRRRGGRGCIREYTALGDDVTVTSTCGRHKFAPWGVDGAQGGSHNGIEVVRLDGSVEHYGKTARLPLKRGERVRIVTATGGGWGDPYERPVESVVEDVRNGYVTVEQARERYGVDLDPATLDVRGLSGGRSD